MILSKIKNMLDSNLSGIIDGAINAVIIKFLSLVIVFLLNIIVARKFGIESSGIFFLGLTIVHLSSVFSRFGFDFILIKHISSDKEKKKYFLDNDYTSIRTVVFLISILVTTVLYFLIHANELSFTYNIIILGIIPLSMLTLTSYAFQGMRKVIVSMLILSVFWQLLCLTIVIFLPIENIYYLSLSYVLSLYVAWGISQKIWNNYIYKGRGKSHLLKVKKYFPQASSLWLVSLMNQLIPWSPIIIIGFFGTASEVGLFNAAFRVSMLIHFISFLMQGIVSSHINPIIENNANSELIAITRKIFFGVLFIGVLLAFVISFMSGFIMSIYGAEFIAGKNILILLVLGQVINLVGSIVPPLLMMSGREKQYKTILFKTSAFSFFCNIVFIYLFGIVGAAWAILFSMGFQASLNILAIKTHFGFWIPSLVEMKK